MPSGSATPALHTNLTRTASRAPGVAASKTTQRPRSNLEIQLSADKTTLAAGDKALLTATVATSVTGTPWVIEIFDQTTQTLAGACAQGNTCQVAFTTTAGDHTFLAYVAQPSAAIPAGGTSLASNPLVVRWLNITIEATGASVVGPGKPVTFTAVASEDVGKIGYRIELVDATTGQGLTYCSRGTTCSSSVIEPNAGTHSLVADLSPEAAGDASQAIQEKSAPVSATWLRVALSASTTSPSQGGTAWLSATANADLTNTPWAIFIYMSPRRLIDRPCQSATCTVGVTLPSGTTPSFFAVIAREADVSRGSDPLTAMLDAARTGSPQSDIQARSAVVTPSRILWGVDSCAAFTQDAAGSTGLLPQVISMLGVPDFWARYLPDTANCPALNSTEVAAAQSLHMGILPIYNNYDCSAVSGYAAGAAYASSAVQIAQADQIPSGTAIAVDIEPPGDQCPGAGNVDAGFISGWYDVISGSGYAPVYYGNTTPGSAFGQAWCATLAQRPEIQSGSYLWSFEPDLSGQFAKRTAPPFGPFASGCGGQYDAWQYQINLGSQPFVDHDEATSRLPLWYP
ncbi:MAG TPA: glycoside hydrolase domain-containing protein [Candidatus Baltobacterales bacterium]|nr:glycoside hydrolase domain-containing protein [Candidatus Baltobacterales bacterium]